MSNKSECQGYIFDPDKQHLVPTSHPQHKFNLTTRRCIRCDLHEFHLPARPSCTVRRVEEDGIIIIIEGPES